MTLGNTLFPGALDTTTELPDVPPTAEQDDAGYEHDLVHKSVAQALRALEGKVGADASAVATSLDNLLRTHTHAGAAVGCAADLVTAQSLGNATWTALNLPSERFDTDGFHDIVTNPSRMTIPAGKGGKYLIVAQANFASNTTGSRQLAIRINGTAVEAATGPALLSGIDTALAVSAARSLNPGDYVEAFGYQNSTGNLNVTSASLAVVALETRSIGAQGSGARVYRSTGQLMSSATFTPASFDSERYDTDAYHDNTTNPTRLTIPKAGRYSFGGQITFPSSTVGQRELAVRLNGATVIADEYITATQGGFDTRMNVSGSYQFAAGDYIELMAWQNTGVNSTVVPEFWITAEDTFATADPSSAGVKVMHNAAQSTVSATDTVLAFNTEVFDTDNYHDPVTNNSRITIPTGKAGKYLFVAGVAFASNATGERMVYIRKNGGTKTIGMTRHFTNTTAAAQTFLEAVGIDDAVAGDYYEVIVNQTSGGALSVFSSADYTPVFSAMALQTQVPTAMNNWVGCVALTTAALSVPNTTNTNVPFETEVEDTDGFHDNVTNNTRFTCPAGKAGRYRLTGQVRWSTNATGSREMYFVKNGVAQKGYSQVDGSASQSRFPQVTDTVRLNAGDYVELQVWQSSGGALTLVGSSLYNWAAIEYLGP